MVSTYLRSGDRACRRDIRRPPIGEFVTSMTVSALWFVRSKHSNTGIVDKCLRNAHVKDATVPSRRWPLLSTVFLKRCCWKFLRKLYFCCVSGIILRILPGFENLILLRRQRTNTLSGYAYFIHGWPPRYHTGDLVSPLPRPYLRISSLRSPHRTYPSITERRRSQ